MMAEEIFTYWKIKKLNNTFTNIVIYMFSKTADIFYYRTLLLDVMSIFVEIINFTRKMRYADRGLPTPGDLGDNSVPCMCIRKKTKTNETLEGGWDKSD